VFEKQATEDGKLYDSIGTKTLVNYLMTNYQIVVATDSFTMEEKIDALGEYEIPFTYEEIEASIPVKVILKQDA
jgi:ribosomal protein L9